MTAEQAGQVGEVREVRWRRVVDPDVLAALAAIVIDTASRRTVSPVDDTTGHSAGPANPGRVPDP